MTTAYLYLMLIIIKQISRFISDNVTRQVYENLAHATLWRS